MLAIGRYTTLVAEIKRIWFANAPSVGIGNYDRSQLAIGYPWSAGVPAEVVTRQQGYRRARGFREDDEFIMLVAKCFLEITQ
jgi:hypothetical protein